MVISLDDQWIWDSWYVHDGEKWHVYFLKADKALIDPELRHTNVSYGHGVSDDLVHWEHLGTCFKPSPAGQWDDFTTWTGSVVQDDEGQWHLFYTGTRQSENGTYQRVGHAVSDDLHNWERVGDGLCLDLIGPSAKYYEADHIEGFWSDRSMRDPWVMKNPNGEGWLVFFTARASGVAESNASGAIGFATSMDLFSWELQRPVYVGGFGQLEVPQVFEANGRWYCLFCTRSSDFSRQQALRTPGRPVTGTHYLIANDLMGPWKIAPGFLDGANPCRRYAARVVQHSDKLWLLGFEDCGQNGEFVGQILDPEPIYIDGSGNLRLNGTHQLKDEAYG